jgi:hypothetical protein
VAALVLALTLVGGTLSAAPPAVAESPASPSPAPPALGDLPACTGTEGPYVDVGVDHRFCPEIAWARAEGIVLPRARDMFRPTATRLRNQAAANLVLVTDPPDTDACDTAPPPFPDVSFRTVFCRQIDQAASAGLVEGYGDGEFRPYVAVSRQAAAAFLYRLDGGRPAGGPCTGAVSSPFPDVPASHPFCTEIATLAAEGVVAGYDDGEFRPTAPLTHQAWIVLLVRRLTVDPASTSLKINEVDYDQPGADDAEFVELVNAGDEPVSLGGVVVELAQSRPLVGGSHAGYRYDLPAVTLAPGDTFVLCHGAVASCDLSLGSGQLPVLGNGVDSRTGAAGAVGLRVHGRIVDALAYEGEVDRSTEGALVPVEAADDDTDDDAADFQRAVPTPGAANACAVA